MPDHETTTRILQLASRVQGYARALMGPNSEADDIAQEVLLRLWARRDKLARVEDLVGFALAMARNLCVDTLRRRSTRRSYSERPPETDPGPNQESEVAAKHALRRALQLSKRLPERQRQILLLREALGCSFSHIATVTGLREANVRMQLSRARKGLRALYEESEGQ